MASITDARSGALPNLRILGRVGAKMSAPRRIQLKRTRGWRLPPNTRSVARPTKYGNPYRIGAPHPLDGHPMSAQDTVELFELHAGPMGDYEIEDADIEALRGFDLACWCDPDEHWCHARPLLLWANS